MGLFDRFKKGLQKSRTTLAERLGSVFRSRKLDESVYEEMEEAFIAADMGVETAMALVENVRTLARKKRIEQAEELPDLMVEAMSAMLSEADSDMNFAAEGPTLVLVVGVNGAGKTTTIGKLANYYLQQNKRVLLAAADTFRAAAIEQLLAWGERAGCDVVRHSQGADPAAVIYDAIQAGRSRNADIILCDTAGRLQNKTHLMAELAKIHKVAARELPGSPHEVLLVLDGTTGQNGLNQAKVFKEVVDVTGIVVTKLDGTAKGVSSCRLCMSRGSP